MITNLLANAGDTKIPGLDPRVSEDPLKEGMATRSPGEPHGPGSLVGCSPWGCKESGHDWTDWARMHTRQ